MLVPVPSLEIATDLLTHGLVNRHRYDWPLPLAYYWMNLED